MVRRCLRSARVTSAAHQAASGHHDPVPSIATSVAAHNNALAELTTNMATTRVRPITMSIGAL